MSFVRKGVFLIRLHFDFPHYEAGLQLIKWKLKGLPFFLTGMARSGATSVSATSIPNTGRLLAVLAVVQARCHQLSLPVRTETCTSPPEKLPVRRAPRRLTGAEEIAAVRKKSRSSPLQPPTVFVHEWAEACAVLSPSAFGSKREMNSSKALVVIPSNKTYESSPVAPVAVSSPHSDPRSALLFPPRTQAALCSRVKLPSEEKNRPVSLLLADFLCPPPPQVY